MSEHKHRSDRYTDYYGETDVDPGHGTPGKVPTTVRLSARPQTNIVFRVANEAAASALGLAFGQRDANGVAAGASDAVDRASSSNGQPLPGDLRDRFEQSLGADLNNVRIHTGSESVEASSALGAKAYTTGHDIHFNAGQYNPIDPFGVHLLAHEVAHTVQQSGAPASGPQAKLEVSTPTDSLELEADRAADAMVRGETATVTTTAPVLARSEDDPAKWLRDEGNAGANEMGKSQIKQPAPALQVSNVRDVAGAESNLRVLEGNQPTLEKGVSQGEVSNDKIVANGAVMGDLRMFLAAGRQQSNSTSNFQQQYATLLRDFGKLETMAQKYSGGSIKDLKKDGAADLVEGQAQSGGSTSQDLNAAFESVKKDPAVKVAIEGVQTCASEIIGLPAKVQQASAKSSGALGALDQALMQLVSATEQTQANELKAQFATAKAKAAKASGLIGSITSMMTGSAKEGFKKGKSAMTDAPIVPGPGGALRHGNTANLSEALLKGLGTGGTALLGMAVDEVWKLVKPKITQLLTELDISVGVFPNMKDDAANAKEIKAAYDAAKAAEQAVSNAKKTIKTDADAYFSAAKDLETKKKTMDRKLELLGEMLQQALEKKGKGAEGQQLAEMTAFVGAGQNFVVQADTCYRIGTQELDARNKDTAAGEARTQLTKFNRGGGQSVHMAYIWTSENHDGETAEHVGTNTVSMKIDTASAGGAFDETRKEAAGLGSADGRFDNDQLGANGVISSALKSVKDMASKANAFVNAVNSMIFGGALSPSE